MKATLRCLALAWLGSVGAALAQTPIYTVGSAGTVPQPGAVHYLQVIDLAQGPGTYTIDAFTIGINFTTGDAQKIFFYFYTGVDTSPASASALAPYTTAIGYSGNVDPGGASGNYSFTYSLSPFSITTDAGGAVAVEITLFSADGSTFSTSANGRFTSNAPSVGTAPGYVWNDANLDSNFTGAEQTRFGMANANGRMALAGTLTRPAAPVLKSYARNGATATLTVDSYSGVTYQLQRATSLTAGNWANIGDALVGTTGSVLTFTDTDGADSAAFYRVVASVPAQSTSSVQSGGGIRNVLRVKE